MTSVEGSDYTYVPQLLNADGSYFAEMVYVHDYLPPYTHRYIESMILGNNAEARTEVGDPWTAFDSATLECWGAQAYVQVSEAATLPATNGVLTLRVPDLADPSGGDEYSVTVVIPPMSRASNHRKGTVQLFTVGVENIRVLGHETY